MTTKAQVTQIPARLPTLPPSGVGSYAATSPTVTAPAATASSSASQSTVSTSNTGMTPLSSANQTLLKANPVGGASDAVSAVRSKVEAEG